MLLDVHLNNYMFDGARADLSKSLNMNPAFQVTHSFTMGASQPNPMGGPSTAGGPGTYNFAALFATNKVCSCSKASTLPYFSNFRMATDVSSDTSERSSCKEA